MRALWIGILWLTVVGGTWAEYGVQDIWRDVGGSTLPENLGLGIFLSGGYAEAISGTVDDEDRVIVAWCERVGDLHFIRACRWNDSIWELLGAEPLVGTDPSVAVDADGNPVVAYVHPVDDQSEIYVARWDGEQWDEMGEGSNSGGGVSGTVQMSLEPDLIRASDGSMILSWRERFDAITQRIFIKEWHGSVWMEMGEGSASGHGIWDETRTRPVLTQGPDGIIALLCRQYSTATISLWSGDLWVDIGRFRTCTPPGTSGDIASTNNSIWISPTYTCMSGLVFDITGELHVAVESDIDMCVQTRGLTSCSQWHYDMATQIYNGTCWEYSPDLSTLDHSLFSAIWHADLECDSLNRLRFGVVGCASGEVFGIYECILGLDDGMRLIHPVEDVRDYEMVVRSGGNVCHIFIEKGHIHALQSGPEGILLLEPSLGGVSRTGDGPEFLQVELNHDGNPVVAWLSVSSEGTNLDTRCWNGENWVPANALPVSVGRSLADPFSLTRDSEGNIAVAFARDVNVDGIDNADIFVARLIGETWELVGTPPDSLIGISGGIADSCRPGLALDFMDNIWVAWIENGRIRVSQWNGAAWSSPDGFEISPEEQTLDDVCLCVDALGNPSVAWEFLDRLYVRRWEESGWIWIGDEEGHSLTDADLDALSLACDSLGNPVVALSVSTDDMAIYVLRWNGQEWESVGENAIPGTGDPGQSILSPHLTIDPQDRITMAWYSHTESGIHVCRWDGEAWREVGLGSASGQGVAANFVGPYAGHDIAVDPLGNLCLVWAHNGRDVFLRSTGPGLLTAGSADASSILDASDLVRVLRHVNGEEAITYPPALDNADVNRDGLVNSIDSEAVIDLLLGSDGDEYEPDDIFWQATPIAFGESQRRHSIAPLGDFDWATFTLGSRDSIRAEVIGASTDVVLYLIRHVGDLQEILIVAPPGPNPRIDATLEPGTYQLLVHDWHHDEVVPDYSLRLSD